MRRNRATVMSVRNVSAERLSQGTNMRCNCDRKVSAERLSQGTNMRHKGDCNDSALVSVCPFPSNVPCLPRSIAQASH
jgi:hypothetical protein